MVSFAAFRSRRVLASALGIAVGVVLLAGGWWFLFGFGPGPGACACSPPAAEFAFAANASDGTTTVRVVHERGDPFPADELFVVVDGDARQWTAGGNATGEREGESAVVAGDTYRLSSVDSGTTIRVVWRADDGDASATLGEYEVS